MSFAIAFFVSFLVSSFALAAWRKRRDVWIHMHSASLFARGDRISLHGTGGKAQVGVVVRVTRSALLVRPL